MSEFTIFGRVSDRISGKGISNLRVEVWDKDGKNDDLCGTAKTNRSGKYSVKFDESKFKDSYKDTLPDIYIKVFHGDELIETTKVQKTFLQEIRKLISEVKLSPESTKKSSPKSTPKAKKEVPPEVVPQPVAAEAEKKPAILATGLEDYGRWKAMFKDHKSEEGKPFRRGRIWS